MTMEDKPSINPDHYPAGDDDDNPEKTKTNKKTPQLGRNKKKIVKIPSGQMSIRDMISHMRNTKKMKTVQDSSERKKIGSEATRIKNLAIQTEPDTTSCLGLNSHLEDEDLGLSEGVRI